MRNIKAGKRQRFRIWDIFAVPAIRWHDLRSTFCTILLKNDFSPKAVSRPMGHAKEIITVDVYGDNQNIIADAVLEINKYMEEVVPSNNAEKESKQDMQEICIDTQEYMPSIE